MIVTGPNRYQYELKGTTAGAAAGVDVTVNGPRGKKAVEIELRNNGAKTVQLNIAALQYVGDADQQVLKPGQKKKIGWQTLQGWYDVEITSPDDSSFRRRLTGREEDGQVGISG